MSEACGLVAGALWAAGFSMHAAQIMVAVAMAESRCQPGAMRTGRGERSVGPLQINVLAHRWVTVTCAVNYRCSARAAYRIYRQRGLGAWTAYRNGRYLRYVRRR